MQHFRHFSLVLMLLSGAGIGGLTTAGISDTLLLFNILRQISVALSKYPDIEVDIFEGAHQLNTIGAGIGLFPRMHTLACDAHEVPDDSHRGPWEVMKKLDLDRDLLQLTELRPTTDDTCALPSLTATCTHLRAAQIVYRRSDMADGFEFYTLKPRGLSHPSSLF